MAPRSSNRETWPSIPGAATTTFGGAVDSFCLGCELFFPPVNLTATAGAFSFRGTLGVHGSLGRSVADLAERHDAAVDHRGLARRHLNRGRDHAQRTAHGYWSAALNAAGDIVQQGGATIDPTDLTMVSTNGGITLNASVTASGSVTLSAANDIIETTTGSIDASTLSASFDDRQGRDDFR